METQEIEVTKIKPYAKNAKKHDKTQIDNVAESIKQFGMVQPLVIDKNNEIVIGHCRFEACKSLGYDKVPCVYVDNLTDEQVKKLRLLDNKLNESDWDIDLLQDDLQGLDFEDFDVDWGLEELEIEPSSDYDEQQVNGVEKHLLKCPVCGHINEEKAFKNYEDTN